MARHYDQIKKKIRKQYSIVVEAACVFDVSNIRIHQIGERTLHSTGVQSADHRIPRLAVVNNPSDDRPLKKKKI
jgi:hypothetical protein